MSDTASDLLHDDSSVNPEITESAAWPVRSLSCVPMRWRNPASLVLSYFVAAAVAGCNDGAAAPPAPATQPATSQQSTSRPTSKPAKPLSETQKIERLIKHVRNLKGAVFIRNGEEHTCAEAAKHMRDKWEWKKREIRTARDFIRVAASKSSMSGRAYLIRFKDGKEVRSGEYLLERLKRIEAPVAAASQPSSRPTTAPSRD